MTLSKIIRYNTGFDNCPENVFFSSQNCIGVKDFQCIPKPADKSNFNAQYDEMKKEKERIENITQILIIVAAVLGGITLCLFLVTVILMCRKKQTSKNTKGGVGDEQSGSKFIFYFFFVYMIINLYHKIIICNLQFALKIDQKILIF